MPNQPIQQFLGIPLNAGVGEGNEIESTRGQLAPGMYLRQLISLMSQASSDAQKLIEARKGSRDKLQEAVSDLDFEQQELDHVLRTLEGAAGCDELNFVMQTQLRRTQHVIRNARQVLHKHRRTIEEAKHSPKQLSDHDKYIDNAIAWTTNVADVSVAVDAYLTEKDTDTLISNEQLEAMMEPELAENSAEMTLAAMLPALGHLRTEERRKQRFSRVQKVLQELRNGQHTPAQLFHELVRTAPGAPPHGLENIDLSALRAATHHMAHSLEHCHSPEDHREAHEYIRTHVLPAVREARQKLRDARIAKETRSADGDVPNHETHDHHDLHMEHVLTQVENGLNHLLNGLGLNAGKGMIPGMPIRKA